MAARWICLVGGSGFLGSRVAHHLAQQGRSVRVLTRSRDSAKHLLVLPTLEVVQSDVFDIGTLEKQLRDCDAVINLVGILHERRRNDFVRVHMQLPHTLLLALQRAGGRRFLHVSALGAARDAPSAYLRSKAEGEVAIKNGRGDVAVTLFRPSVIFGPGDSFLSLFAKVVSLLPVVALACPNARFQPVFVDDVARAIVSSIDQPETFGESYDLCGPKIYTLRELVKLVSDTLSVRRPIIGLSAPLSYLQALLMEFAPGKLLTRDNVRSMSVPNTCACPFPSIFDPQPVALESVITSYIGGGVQASLQQMRRYARRS